MAQPDSYFTSYNWENPSTPSAPWRILTLDGGGVRGLAELLILERIFKQMNIMLGRNESDDPLRPCDYFDIIGGTSTGGLIALMLGRLRLPIPEAIRAFIDIAGTTFPIGKNPGFWKAIKIGVGSDLYDSEVLVDKVRGLLVSRGQEADTSLREREEPRCKVFVTSTGVNTLHPKVLRSYSSTDIGQAELEMKVWQAARATSAAPMLFNPITVDRATSSVTLVDGALRLNNPIQEALREATSLDRERDFGCVVSIGTGTTMLPYLDKKNHIFKVASVCAQMCKDCEVEHTQFLRGRDGERLSRERKYFRFNVPSLAMVAKSDAWERREAIQEHVENYLATMRLDLEACAQRLLGDFSNDLSSMSSPSVSSFPDSSAFHQRQRNSSASNNLGHTVNIGATQSTPVFNFTNVSMVSSLGVATEPARHEQAGIPGPGYFLTPHTPHLRHARSASSMSSFPASTLSTPSLEVTSRNRSRSASRSSAQTTSSLPTPNSSVATLSSSNTPIRPSVSHYYSAPSLETELANELATGNDLLSRLLATQAHTHFKRAQSLLTHAALSPAHKHAHTSRVFLGLTHSHVQQASSHGGQPGRSSSAAAHLRSAGAYAVKALQAAGDEGARQDAQLALIVVAVTKAEAEVEATGQGTGRGAGRMDAVQAGCLLEQVEGFLRGVRGRGAESERLREKAGVWRARLLERHLEVPRPLGGTVELG